MFTLVIFLLILGLLVLVHEFGHFFAARKSGVKVEEFGFGFPPRIFGIQLFKENRLEKIAEKENVELQVTSYTLQDETKVVEETIKDTVREIDAVVPFKKWRFVWGNKGVEKLREENEGKEGTVYSINLIPLGGFVSIKGEDGSGSDSDSLNSKKPWQRAIVMVAGVAMNIVLAAVLLSIGYMFGLPQMTDGISANGIVKNKRVEILQVMEGKPAALAGLQTGDSLVKVDTLENGSVRQIQDYVDAHKNETISVTVKRGEETITKDIKPFVYPDTGKGGLGVAIAEVGIVSYPWYAAIYHGCVNTVLYLWQILVAFFFLIKGLLSGAGTGGDIAGPVGIAVMTGRVARLGFSYLIQFSAVLSLNLAILNILPIPALDGGKLLFLLIGKIRGKQVDNKLENIIHMIGFGLLLLFVFVITIKDVGAYSSTFSALWNKIF